MRAALLGFVVILLAPSLAQAWGLSSSAKKWSQPKKPTSSSYTNPSTSYKQKTPLWKRRYDSRRQRQWSKPGGVNFPTPSRRTRVIVLKRKQMPLNQREKNDQAITQVNKKRQKNLLSGNRRRAHNRTMFTRFRQAWKSRWKNRAIKANRQSPFSSTAGFGASVRRASPRVGMSWRLRRDLRRRIMRSPARPTVPMM
jgi:hypothetical protein